ncbi:SCP-like extracellular protein [Lewinellaceae bacterium SD302]|nr:SCP-like extracellular protein [Lewinellaceae bacterium SD302]
MRYWKISLFALLALFTFSCEEDFTFEPSEDNESGTVVEPDPEPTGAISAEYQLLLDLTNDLRAAGCDCGGQYMPPVTAVSWSTTIATAALAHSRDMDQNNHFDHTGTDGSSPGDRLTEAGYNWRTYGENIALRYTTASAVFNGWKNSPGHCRNMMNAGFKEMGAAQVGDYYTQDFGAR